MFDPECESYNFKYVLSIYTHNISIKYIKHDPKYNYKIVLRKLQIITIIKGIHKYYSKTTGLSIFCPATPISTLYEATDHISSRVRAVADPKWGTNTKTKKENKY